MADAESTGAMSGLEPFWKKKRKKMWTKKKTDNIQSIEAARKKRGLDFPSRRIFLGIGPPRRGSRTLTKILNLQKRATVWQDMAWLPWKFDEKIFYRYLANILAIGSAIAGDNGFCWLNYAERAMAWTDKMLHLYMPLDIRIVCLKREKAKTVASILRNSEPGTTNFTQKGSKWFEKHNKWALHYPKYDLPNEEACARYWEDYYAKAEMLALKYPDVVRVFDTDVTLRDKNALRELLSFVGILEEEMIIRTDIWEGKGDSYH